MKEKVSVLAPHSTTRRSDAVDQSPLPSSSSSHLVFYPLRCPFFPRGQDWTSSFASQSSDQNHKGRSANMRGRQREVGEGGLRYPSSPGPPWLRRTAPSCTPCRLPAGRSPRPPPGNVPEGCAGRPPWTSWAPALPLQPEWGGGGSAATSYVDVSASSAAEMCKVDFLSAKVDTPLSRGYVPPTGGVKGRRVLGGVQPCHQSSELHVFSGLLANLWVQLSLIIPPCSVTPPPPPSPIGDLMF